MKRIAGVFVLLALLSPPPATFALDYLNTSMQNKIRMAPKNYNRTLYESLGELGTAPRWHVAQWGILQELPNFTNCLGLCDDGLWQTGNAHGYVKVSNSLNLGNTVELHQDSGDAGYACEEYDLFFEPNEVTGYPAYPAAVLPEASLPSLGAVTNFRVQVLQQVVSAIHGTRCPRPYNLASTVIALVFHNRFSSEGLFYQIITYDSRDFPFDGSWFFTTPPYGVNDDILTNYGQPRLVPGGLSIFYDIDVAARLKSLIQSSGSPVADKEVNHWKFVGAYFGSMVNGEAVITSRLSLIRIFSD